MVPTLIVYQLIMMATLFLCVISVAFMSNVTVWPTWQKKDQKPFLDPLALQLASSAGI